jgi:hypothetical protein
MTIGRRCHGGKTLSPLAEQLIDETKIVCRDEGYITK